MKRVKSNKCKCLLSSLFLLEAADPTFLIYLQIELALFSAKVSEISSNVSVQVRSNPCKWKDITQ